MYKISVKVSKLVNSLSLNILNYLKSYVFTLLLHVATCTINKKKRKPFINGVFQDIRITNFVLTRPGQLRPARAFCAARQDL